MGILLLISGLSFASSIIFQIHTGHVPTAYQVFDISFYHFVPFLLWLLYLPFVHRIATKYPVNAKRHWSRHLVISLAFAFSSRVLAIWVDFAIKNATGMTDTAPHLVLWDVRWVVVASLPKEILMYWSVIFLITYFENSVPSKQVEKLILDSDKGKILLTSQELLLVEASRNYIIAHTATGNYKSRKTLKSIISQLDDQFVQIHRSRIVNVEAVTRIIPWRNGEYMLELQNGLHVSSSRSYQHNVKAILQRDTIRPAIA